MTDLNRRVFMQKVALGATGATFSTNACLGLSGSAQPEVAGQQKIFIPTWYYQNFDAHFESEVPEQGFGGWKKTVLEFPRQRTALAVMHAWDMGTKEQYPGWWRAAPWAQRAATILEKVFPKLLGCVRTSGLKVFHIASSGNGYYSEYPGYQITKALCEPVEEKTERMRSDPLTDKIIDFRKKNVFVGNRNEEDVKKGFADLDFPANAKPLDSEPIAVDSRQLLALCKKYDVNHLIYCGFCINWCLLLSPGGMAEMSQYGVLCSAIRDAVCAVENKETATHEIAKELALWRVALAYGFVFDLEDLTTSLSKK